MKRVNIIVIFIVIIFAAILTVAATARRARCARLMHPHQKCRRS